MDDKNNNLELFDLYNSGAMPIVEKNAFGQRLESDKAFKSSYQDYLDILEFNIELGNKDLKSKLAKIEMAYPQSEPAAGKSPWRWITAAALISILTASFFYFNKGTNSQDLYNEYFTAYPNELALLERSESKVTELQQAMQYYQSGDYDKAISNFDQLMQSGNNQEVLFYKGVALLGQDNAQGAMDAFADLDNQTASKYKSAILWYSSLAELKLERIDEAKVYLNEILTSEQKFRRTSAQKLLDSLK